MGLPRKYRPGDPSYGGVEVVNSRPIPKPRQKVDFDVTPHGSVVALNTAYQTYRWDEVAANFPNGSTVVVPAMYYHSTGEELTFTARAIETVFVNPIVEWRWDFGDGTEAVGQVVTHTYQVANPGVIVHLRATDDQGEFSYASMNLMLNPQPAAPPMDAITGLTAYSSKQFTLQRDTFTYTYNLSAFGGPVGGMQAYRSSMSDAATLLDDPPVPGERWLVEADLPDADLLTWQGGVFPTSAGIRFRALTLNAFNSSVNDYLRPTIGGSSSTPGWYPDYDSADVYTFTPRNGGVARHATAPFTLGSHVGSRTDAQVWGSATRGVGIAPFGAMVEIFFEGPIGGLGTASFPATVMAKRYVGGVRLGWNDPTQTISHYNVYRKVGNSSYGAAIYTGTQTGFVDSTVTQWGQPHTYKVTYVDASSNESAPAEFTITPDQPPA